MNFNMFIEICPLSKAELTVFMWALIWSFICVDSKVIKEIVPFPKSLPALFEIALKNFYKSLRLWVFEGIDPELLCSRYMFFNVNRP